MGILRVTRRFVTIVAAAFVGAALADLVQQHLTGEKGRIIIRSKDGPIAVNIPPGILIPAIFAGLRAKNRPILVSFFMAAVASGTGGKGLGGIPRGLPGGDSPR